MKEISQDTYLNQTATLLKLYGFEMKGCTLQELIEQWLSHYPMQWMRLAIIEALYQGRYKVISVEEILKLWRRKGQPTFHFTHEFERLICNNLLSSTQTGLKSKPSKTYHTQDFNPSFEQEISKRSASRCAIEPETASSLEIDNHTDTEESSVEVTAYTATNSQYLDIDPKTIMTDLNKLFSQFVTEAGTPTSATENSLESGKSTANESSVNPTRQSIHEFTPLLDGSQFYSKLKAVARRSL